MKLNDMSVKKWWNEICGREKLEKPREKLSNPVVPWLLYLPLETRLAGSYPAGVNGFFQSIKIVNMTSFGREVKPWVPCRRFIARERT